MLGNWFYASACSSNPPKVKMPCHPQLISPFPSCFLNGTGCKSVLELVQITVQLTNSVIESNGWKHDIKTISYLPTTAL